MPTHFFSPHVHMSSGPKERQVGFGDVQNTSEDPQGGKTKAQSIPRSTSVVTNTSASTLDVQMSEALAAGGPGPFCGERYDGW